MTYTPPTVQEERDYIDSVFESKIEQNIPSLAKSFVSILKNTLAFITIPIYKYVADTYKQSFTITASEVNLVNVHGQNLDTQREDQSKFKSSADVDVSGNATITTTTTFENPNNGLFYFPEYDQPVTAGTNEIDIISDGYGSGYNLEPDDTLDILEQITDVGSLATINTVSQYAVDKEDTEAYRRRLINEQSSASGGGNTADYRRWSEAVNGVYRTFPFPGRPLDPVESKPGDITVYVEADLALGTDGIADSTLLASTRSEILVDPLTDQTRPALGDTEELLFVESISHVEFDITVNNIIVEDSLSTELQTRLNNAVDEYLRSIAPYCFGIDPEWLRDDNVSSVTISHKVNEVLKTYGATASSVVVTESGVGVVTNRQLLGGETARIGTLTLDMP